MSDALLVLNAGSSSLKFSVFLNQDLPQPVVRGQIEGLTGQPRFVARDDSLCISQPVAAFLGGSYRRMRS